MSGFIFSFCKCRDERELTWQVVEQLGRTGCSSCPLRCCNSVNQYCSASLLFCSKPSIEGLPSKGAAWIYDDLWCERFHPDLHYTITSKGAGGMYDDLWSERFHLDLHYTISSKGAGGIYDDLWSERFHLDVHYTIISKTHVVWDRGHTTHGIENRFLFLKEL